jgi:predicted nucleic acid-binding protein
MTFFWKSSVFRKLASRQDLELFSPQFALEEINKYEQELLKKTGITKSEFAESRIELARLVEFVPLEEYEGSFSKVNALIKGLSLQEQSELLKDADFLALSSSIGIPLWSNDKLLKQSKLQVLSTEEMIKLLEPSQ